MLCKSSSGRTAAIIPRTYRHAARHLARRLAFSIQSSFQLIARCILPLALTLLPSAPVSRASKRPEWMQLRTPNFIVVTNTDSEKQARLVGREFELIRAVFL